MSVRFPRGRASVEDSYASDLWRKYSDGNQSRHEGGRIGPGKKLGKDMGSVAVELQPGKLCSMNGPKELVHLEIGRPAFTPPPPYQPVIGSRLPSGWERPPTRHFL